MPRTRRSFPADFKARLYLALLRGEVSQAELCRKHNIKSQLLAHWKSAVVDRLHTLFEGDVLNETPEGDGRVSRHQVQGVQLIDKDKMMTYIPYAAIIWGEGKYLGRSITFDAFRGETHYRVTIEGDGQFQSVVDKLTIGKREQVRWNGVSITRVSVEKVTES